MREGFNLVRKVLEAQIEIQRRGVFLNKLARDCPEFL